MRETASGPRRALRRRARTDRRRSGAAARDARSGRRRGRRPPVRRRSRQLLRRRGFGRADHRDFAARGAGRAARVRRPVPAAVAPSGHRRPPARDDRAARARVGSRSASGSAARTATRSRSAGSTRRRVDAEWTSASSILRRLADGTPVTFDGEFFALDDALILPAPSPAIPLIVGGRSDAAVSRAAQARRRLARDLGLAPPVRRGARSDRAAGHRGRAGPEPVRARAQRLVRLRDDPRGGPRAPRHADAGLLPNALRAVRALLAVRDARRRRGVPAPLHRRRLLDLQRDPVRARRRRARSPRSASFEHSSPHPCPYRRKGARKYDVHHEQKTRCDF